MYKNNNKSLEFDENIYLFKITFKFLVRVMIRNYKSDWNLSENRVIGIKVITNYITFVSSIIMEEVVLYLE